MDVNQRNAAALQERTNKLMAALVKRFENTLALAAPDKTDFNSTAHKNFQMQVETAALIRAAEDILTLTRQMQELWLFGQLKTLETENRRDSREPVNARALVAEVEERVMRLL
ncbi:uncharacterized protein K452DRAFT_357038 [Aplosporella prunicola CBS 121167]|uniref:Mediator of RNA polymerase II transcription subunit 22 n=1 Tax=Aplosporella prunicola CBS 121167 TaxID=1176127 RepID=A0A6A6BKD6_9PEZI|nr:uncharacterized protein K452DRAFT_357038 [Aplosporella prunicola CBS 121167]KAF2144108.1 hypothetical protein K452DRAFT_357038 [Aplosporella prunicola CBS 121167]